MPSNRNVFIGADGGALRGHEIGAAMVEFAIFLPIMLLFIAGVLELGRLFNQMAWAQRSVYEAAYLGSFFPENSRNIAVIDRLRMLTDLQNKDFLPDYTTTEQARATDSTFSVQLVANRNAMTRVPLAMDLAVNSSLRAPVLYPRVSGGAFDTFANPSKDGSFRFNCDKVTCACDPTTCEADYSPNNLSGSSAELLYGQFHDR